MYQDHINTPKQIRVIPRRPEQVFELGEQRMHGEKPQFEFRVLEVPTPVRGDEIELGGRVYQITEEPQLDLHQLIWGVETLEVI